MERVGSDVELGKNVTNSLHLTASPTTSLDDSNSTSSADSWSKDIEDVLEDIRANSEELSKHHKQSYIVLQAQLVYFRVPLIIISALNSVFSVGLNAYLVQTTVSTINCLMSLICACISSVELFLQIQKKLELELNSYHGYYLLGAKISSVIKLDRTHREIEGLVFLNTIVNDYSNLFENSCVSNKDITDQLLAKMEHRSTLSQPKRLPDNWSLSSLNVKRKS
jgi:hypothetical protein